VLEPGKVVKTDKTSIIADAIRIVTQLRAENGQLRQLNKFLEVRPAAWAPPCVWAAGRSGGQGAGLFAYTHTQGACRCCLPLNAGFCARRSGRRTWRS
jgi:hypothetical protein